MTNRLGGRAIAIESADGYLWQLMSGRTVQRLDYRNSCYPPTLTAFASPSSRPVARWLARSDVVDFGYAKQTQHRALQPVQLSREDHIRSPSNSQRVPLHILKQVDQPSSCGMATLSGNERISGDHLRAK